MTKEIILYVDEQGEVKFVHDDEVMDALLGTGKIQTQRASHVEPAMTSQINKRGTKWEIDLDPIIPGEYNQIGPYDSRAEALAAEVAWLEWHFTYGAKWMTKYQLGKAIELRNLGWEPAGVDLAPDNIGSPPVMRDLLGKLHKIKGDGEAVLLTEEELRRVTPGHAGSPAPGGTPG